MVKKILGILTGLWCFAGIILTIATPAQSSKLQFIVFAIVSGVACFLLLHKPTEKSIRKKEKQKQHNIIDEIPVNTIAPDSIETNSMIYRTDNESITDEQIPYLIQAGLKDAIESQKLSSNIIFHRTEYEENLAIQFMVNHGSEIQKHTQSFENLNRLAYAECDLNKKIELLQEVIVLFEKEKKWFYRTKGGSIYFQDYYEHQHNSRNNDFSYIYSVKSYLEDCIQKRDYIIPELIRLITSSNGILQKDVYKYLPNISKTDIQRIIHELVDNNVITRTKKGNSYSLSLK